MFPSRASLGPQGLGYWRGSDIQAGGSGSGMGMANQGTAGLSSGLSMPAGMGNWHPTVLYLVGLVIVELIVFGWIGKLLK